LPSGQHCTTLSGHIFATKARIDNPKKTYSNSSSTCPQNMVNFGPLMAEICWRVWAPQLISTGFASWQCYCMALWQWASAKLCGVEQRAPPIVGRAAITFGTGPHSSLSYLEADIEVFRPAGATRCTNGGEIWHGGADLRSPPMRQISPHLKFGTEEQT